MVRLVTSQWFEPDTLVSVLVKFTSQETLVLVLTVKVELVVVSVLSAAVVAFVSVFVYSWPLTAEPEVAPQLSPVYSWTDNVPLNGAPLVAVTDAVSLGSQVWVEALAVVSVTVKHSPDEASLDPV